MMLTAAPPPQQPGPVLSQPPPDALVRQLAAMLNAPQQPQGATGGMGAGGMMDMMKMLQGQRGATVQPGSPLYSSGMAQPGQANFSGTGGNY